jgi:hypothetical protein
LPRQISLKLGWNAKAWVRSSFDVFFCVRTSSITIFPNLKVAMRREGTLLNDPHL